MYRVQQFIWQVSNLPAWVGFVVIGLVLLILTVFAYATSARREAIEHIVFDRDERPTGAVRHPWQK